MSRTHTLVMGSRGRLVIPAEVRSGMHWHPGTRLIAVQTETGVNLMSVDQAQDMIAEQLIGHDLVAELIADRRATAE